MEAWMNRQFKKGLGPMIQFGIANWLCVTLQFVVATSLQSPACQMIQLASRVSIRLSSIHNSLSYTFIGNPLSRDKEWSTMLLKHLPTPREANEQLLPRLKSPAFLFDHPDTMVKDFCYNLW
jgi:hypothetical protein